MKKALDKQGSGLISPPKLTIFQKMSRLFSKKESIPEPLSVALGIDIRAIGPYELESLQNAFSLEAKGRFYRAGDAYIDTAVCTNEPGRKSKWYGRAAENYIKSGNIKKAAMAYSNAALHISDPAEASSLQIKLDALFAATHYG